MTLPERSTSRPNPPSNNRRKPSTWSDRNEALSGRSASAGSSTLIWNGALRRLTSAMMAGSDTSAKSSDVGCHASSRAVPHYFASGWLCLMAFGLNSSNEGRVDSIPFAGTSTPAAQKIPFSTNFLKLSFSQLMKK